MRPFNAKDGAVDVRGFDNTWCNSCQDKDPQTKMCGNSYVMDKITRGHMEDASCCPYYTYHIFN
jgi:hypothetical protein